jgi:hypothetical protein
MQKPWTRTTRLTLPCLLIASFGCGPPQLDTSSDAKAVASLERLRQSLPEDKRAEFDQAMMTIVLSRLSGKRQLEIEQAGPAGLDALALRPLDGMTAQEVMTEARRIAADAARRSRSAGSPDPPPR